ncbi:Hypothetical_protein [Hexamita inflata]|uniref:Hypothetical_protein n=1 Tax=Hexamita inflata TaxID=28002 RepID=A0AA86QQK3_9EUKA|nr:Hypothetical protein HINF_LOCUS48807 [Hexamita inflata]
MSRFPSVFIKKVKVCDPSLKVNNQSGILKDMVYLEPLKSTYGLIPIQKHSKNKIILDSQRRHSVIDKYDAAQQALQYGQPHQIQLSKQSSYKQLDSYNTEIQQYLMNSENKCKKLQELTIKEISTSRMLFRQFGIDLDNLWLE